jgi:hypothetical protein
VSGHSALAVANGSRSGELRLIDVRDEDGELCRRVPLDRAQQLIDRGAGIPHIVRGELRMVRLKHVDGTRALLPHVQTWQREAQPISGAKTAYAHSHTAHEWNKRGSEAGALEARRRILRKS